MWTSAVVFPHGFRSHVLRNYPVLRCAGLPSMVMVMPLTMIVPGMPVLIRRIRLIIRMG